MSAALHAAMVFLVLASLVWACRFVYRRSRFAGLMFSAGLVIRASGAAFFLAVSYFGLPVMTRLQMGDGFWTLASDAREYYRLGSLVAERWQPVITWGYVEPLALWMRLVGVTPASPVLFSLAAHALAVVTLVAAFGQNRTRAAQQALNLCVAAFSFSPMLIFGSVFGLKDVFVATLVVMLFVAYLTLVTAAWTRATLGANLLAAAGAGAAMWLIAGVRSYFAILLWIAMGVAYAGCVIAGRPSRLRAAVQAAIVLPAFALVIGAAEPAYPRFVVKIVASVFVAVAEQRAPLDNGGLGELDRRRVAIDGDGGDSIFNRRRVHGTADRLKGLAVGLSAEFVPSVVLEGLSAVHIPIQISARVVADADTLLIDVTTVLALWLLVVNRGRLNPAALIFAATAAVLVALPLAYVMTNFGTLVRLRLMVAVPIWLVTLALAPRFAPPALFLEAGDKR